MGTASGNRLDPSDRYGRVRGFYECLATLNVGCGAPVAIHKRESKNVSSIPFDGEKRSSIDNGS